MTAGRVAVAVGLVLARAVTLCALCGGAVALRILERGEAISPRSLAVIGLFAAGGFLAGLVVGPALDRLGIERIGPRAVVGGFGGIVLVLGTAFALYALDRNADSLLWSLREEGVGEFVRHTLIGLTLDAAGAFAVTGRGYLLPWPLVAMLLSCAGVLAPLARSPLREPTARVT